MSEVAICNQALLKVGQSKITSLTQETEAASNCALFYPILRDAIQYEYDWTFCTFWETLAQLATPPLSEYANAYQLPADTLRVLFVGENYNNQRPYRVEQNVIVTDDTTCKAQLIKRVEEPSRWSPLFRMALVYRLAAELAIPFTNSRSLHNDFMAVYMNAVGTAKSMDGAQGKPRRARSKWIEEARGQGPSVAGPYV